jgi:hypothetical protein
MNTMYHIQGELDRDKIIPFEETMIKKTQYKRTKKVIKNKSIKKRKLSIKRKRCSNGKRRNPKTHRCNKNK